MISDRLRKSDFVLQDDIIFLNHGSFGACPTELLDRQRHWIERLERQPVLFHRELHHLMRTAREAAAGYLHAQPEDLVLVTNSTYGVNVAAHALRQLLEPEDEVLTTDHEYGACLRTWDLRLRHTGAVLVSAEIPIPAPPMEDLVELIWQRVTDRTRIIFLSTITSASALRLPVEEICRRARQRGIITVIDAAHVPGHISLDLTALNADVVTGNFHKWMCTPKGSAFLWVHPSMQPAFIPFIISWGNAIPTVGDGAFIDDHEYLGTRDVSPLLTLPDALAWMERVQWDQIQATARALRDRTMEQLLQIPGIGAVGGWPADQLMMGAVTLPAGTDVAVMKQRLYDEYHIEVVVHLVKSQPVLRFSVHAHTSPSDLDALVRAVAHLVQ